MVSKQMETADAFQKPAAIALLTPPKIVTAPPIVQIATAIPDTLLTMELAFLTLINAKDPSLNLLPFAAATLHLAIIQQTTVHHHPCAMDKQHAKQFATLATPLM